MYFNRFDILEAYYLFFSYFHEGMNSRKYARMSKMVKYFWPRSSLCEDTLSENGRAIYDALVERVGYTI